MAKMLQSANQSGIKELYPRSEEATGRPRSAVGRAATGSDGRKSEHARPRRGLDHAWLAEGRGGGSGPRSRAGLEVAERGSVAGETS